MIAPEVPRDLGWVSVGISKGPGAPTSRVEDPGLYDGFGVQSPRTFKTWFRLNGPLRTTGVE